MMTLKTPPFLLLGAFGLSHATSTVIVTSPLSACAPSVSSAPYVTVYNTTNSAGATFLTSSTVSPGQPSVSSFTTTNSDGSTILTSTTVTPNNAASSASASGSSAQTASGTVASEAPGASPSAPCPQAAFAENYVAKSGADWQIFCSADVYYYSLPSLMTETFEECIDACDAYQPSGTYGNYPCVAVTWTTPGGADTSNCLLKYGVDQVVYGTPNYCSAKLASYVLPPNFPVSIVSTYSSTAVPTSASATLTYATGTQVTQYQSASPCPLTNQSTYTVPDGKGISYEILCGVSLEYDDLPDINVASFEDCMAACNDYVPAPPGEPYDQPCIAVTYIGQNGQLPSCFRHYSLSQYYTVDGSPYGDSAVRKNPATKMKRSQRLHHWDSLLQLEKRLDPRKIRVGEFIQARERLASQGIGLILAP